MAENTIWKVYFFADNKNTQPNRIHGLDPWIQIGSMWSVSRAISHASAIRSRSASNYAR